MTKEEKIAYKQTNEYKYKKYRNISYAFYGASWITALAPEGIVLGINWNNWITNQSDGIKVSTALILLILSTLFVSYKKIQSEIKFNYLSLVVSFWVATGIVFLINSLLSHILIILVCSSIGLTASLGLEIPAEVYKEKKEEYKDESKTESTLTKALKNVFGLKNDNNNDKGTTL